MLLEGRQQKLSRIIGGSKLLGYKEFIFLFGGQYLVGQREWNHNFWVYDNLREKWERKVMLVCSDIYYLLLKISNIGA